MSDRALPFGLLFAEEIPEGPAVPELTYDDSRDLSLVTLANGRVVPYLSLLALQGTSTFTRVQAEEDDTDPSENAALGTHTRLTAVQQEQQDQDVATFAASGTTTHTCVASESIDTDPSSES